MEAAIRKTSIGSSVSSAESGRAKPVDPRVAMRILRHAQIDVTMNVDTEVSDAKTRQALRRRCWNRRSKIPRQVGLSLIVCS